MGVTAQLNKEVDVLTSRFEQLEKRALSFVKVQNILGAQLANQSRSNKQAEKLMRMQISLQAKILKQLEKTTAVNAAQIKTTDEFTESTKKASKATDELDKKLERVENTATGFNKRNIILTKAISKYTFEQQKGFTLGIQSFRDYRKFGGNALEYVAEFLTATREEVQIFGMEAAKIRKVMYGFLPPGTFRLVNKVASTFQFLGGAMRNLSVEGEETNNAYLKLFRTLMAFSSLKSMKKVFDLRNIVSTEVPGIKKLDAKFEKLKEKRDSLEKGSSERKEVQTEMRLVAAKRRTMANSPEAEMRKTLKQNADSLMKALGSRPELKKERENLKNQIVAKQNLEARFEKAKAVGDKTSVKILGEKIAEAIEKKEEIKTKIRGLAPEHLQATLSEAQREHSKAIDRANTIERMYGMNSPQAEAADKEVVEKGKNVQKAEDALANEVPELGKSFGAFGKSFKKFAKFSMSNKVKELRKGLKGIVKGVGGIIKAVFVGFLKFFIAVSLILIAALAIKKLFEKFKVGEGFALIKEFFQTVKPIFISLFERVKDGFKLIVKAFQPGGTFGDLLLGLWKIVSGILGIYFTALGTLFMAGLILLGNFLEKQLTKIGEKIVNKFNEIQAPLSKILKVIRVITIIAFAIAAFASGAWIPALAIAIVGGIVVGIQTLLGKKLGLFAKGGTVNTPLQIVGEEGPELVALPQGSMIRTASQTRKALSTSSQTVNNFNITVNAKDSSREEMRRMANEISRIISRDIQRSTTSATLG